MLNSKSRMHGSGIYQITFLPTGDTYIGQATSITGRWGTHCSSLGHHLGLPRIAHLVATQEIEEVRFKVLKRCDPADLSYWEAYFCLQIQPTLNTDDLGKPMKTRVRADHPELANIDFIPRSGDLDPEVMASIKAYKAMKVQENAQKDENQRQKAISPEEFEALVEEARQRHQREVSSSDRLRIALGFEPKGQEGSDEQK